ncbi:MAG: hypothetical protein A2X08_12795 [Bacteroidetes bacterium GWA2_32_17]|nr:MAG: hypothetical protein A2X08_12795 [Bacteroidetes bacterium GWA2_32_17]
MLISALSFSQWILQNPLLQSNTLYSVFFADANTGYATGAVGTIIKTTDAGSTWAALTSGTTNDLHSVYFTDVNTGYAVGNSGTILKTSNAGNTWITLSSGTLNNLNAVYFTDVNTGYAVGNSGTIRKTSNAGSTWTTLSSGTPNNLNSVYFIGVNTGYAVGDYGTIRKTSNAGSSWSTLLSNTTNTLYSVYFTDLNNGFTSSSDGGSSGKIYKTSDAGSSWSISLNKGPLQSIYFTDINTGYAVGYDGMNNIGGVFKTTDAGSTWTAQASGTYNTLYSVYFTATNTGYAVGANGTILKTINSGSTWTTFPQGTTNLLYSIYFPDANTGYAAGNIGTIVKTTNAGSTWTVLSTGTTVILFSVYFTDANTGYATGQFGTILKTTNAGSTWTVLPSGTSFYDLHSVIFTDANTGYAAGYVGIILKTIDAGSSWSPLSSETNNTLLSVYFTDADTGYAVGYSGTIIKTTDAGITFTVLSSGTTNILNSVYFTNDSTGYAVGYNGRILKTSNGGTTWTTLTSGITNTLFSVYFNDANTGYVVGDNGIILKTSNGGNTWTTQISGTTNTLVSVYFTDECTGYSAGQGGTILKTNNGGVLVNNSQTICDGDSYTLNSHTYTTAGTYYDTLSTILGCDSIIITQLTVNPIFSINNNQSICDSDSYILNGHTYTTTGTYYDTLQTYLGCDSIIITNLTVNPFPVYAGTISGLTTVCQNQNSVIYTVSTITNATSYFWTLPAGATGTSSTNTITISYGISALSGDISVKGTNSCGDGNSSTLSINVNPLPDVAGIISGTTTVCQGQNAVTYTVPVITDATSYVWTLPAGATGTITTNSITVNYNVSALSGNITVKGNNSCGDGVLSTLSIIVNPLPANADTINGMAAVCQGQSSVTYTVPTISDATSYIWTLPSGASGSSITNSITVDYDLSATSGEITVKGINSCGEGVASTLAIIINSSIPANAGTISGTTTICQNQNSETYTVPVIANATTYIWTLPAGATGTSMTNSITINYGTSASSGNITVKGTNGCGDGGSSTLVITVNPAYAFTENHSICDGETYSWHGQSLTTADTFYTNLQTQEGCDSTYTLTLTVNPVYTYIETHAICNGDVYLWHGQSLIIADLYYDSFQTQAGCDSIYTLNLLVNSIPNVSFSGLDSMYCIYSSSVSLTGNPPGGIFSGTGIIENTFDPNTAGAGTYDIVYSYTDGNSCNNSDTAVVIVDLCLGIKVPEKAKGISIFPNPFSEQTTIEFSNPANSQYLLTVSDITGKEIIKQNIFGNTFIIERRTLESGFYTVELKGENRIYCEKIIVE